MAGSSREWGLTRRSGGIHHVPCHFVLQRCVLPRCPTTGGSQPPPVRTGVRHAGCFGSGTADQRDRGGGRRAGPQRPVPGPHLHHPARLAGHRPDRAPAPVRPVRPARALPGRARPGPGLPGRAGRGDRGDAAAAVRPPRRAARGGLSGGPDDHGRDQADHGHRQLLVGPGPDRPDAGQRGAADARAGQRRRRHAARHAPVSGRAERQLRRRHDQYRPGLPRCAAAGPGRRQRAGVTGGGPADRGGERRSSAASAASCGATRSLPAPAGSTRPAWAAHWPPGRPR